MQPGLSVPTEKGQPLLRQLSVLQERGSTRSGQVAMLTEGRSRQGPRWGSGRSRNDPSWSTPACSTHKDAHFTLSKFRHSLHHAGLSLSSHAISFLFSPTPQSSAWVPGWQEKHFLLQPQHSANCGWSSRAEETHMSQACFRAMRNSHSFEETSQLPMLKGPLCWPSPLAPGTDPQQKEVRRYFKVWEMK